MTNQTQAKLIGGEVSRICAGFEVAELERLIETMQNNEQTKYMLDIIQILLHRIQEKEDAIANFEKQNAKLKEMITNVLSKKERRNSGASADAVQYAYEEEYSTPPMDKYASLPPLSTTKILSTRHFSPPTLFVGSPAEHHEEGHPNVLPLHISTKKTPSKRHLTVNTPRGYSLYEHTLNKRASSVCSPKRDYDDWLVQSDRNLLPIGPCTQ